MLPIFFLFQSKCFPKKEASQNQLPYHLYIWGVHGNGHAYSNMV